MPRSETIADVQVHRDRVYIFEEYCEGGSLADLLEHGRVEDEEVVMVYALQMLQGLEYLHSKGIEHRDVKPDSEWRGGGHHSWQTSYWERILPSNLSTLEQQR